MYLPSDQLKCKICYIFDVSFHRAYSTLSLSVTRVCSSLAHWVTWHPNIDPTTQKPSQFSTIGVVRVAKLHISSPLFMNPAAKCQLGYFNFPIYIPFALIHI